MNPIRKKILCLCCVVALLFSSCAMKLLPDDRKPSATTEPRTETAPSSGTGLTETVASETSPVEVKPLSLGINLEGASDWSVSWPFNDIMKLSRVFFTQNQYWVEGGENEWDTEVIDRIPMGENGYPLELPANIEGMEAPQVVTTVWANTQAMPKGDYRVYYDGQGKIEFGLDATGEDSGAGRMVMHLTDQANIASMSIVESLKEDPVRNIRIYLPGADPNELFNPEWLKMCEPFSVIRLMDWGQTNYSPLSDWSDRAKPEDITFTAGKGYPYEHMIELSNRLHKDIWICIPHLADDEYIRNLSELLSENLDPDIRVYVEYSNEIWNWMFDQANYLYEQGDSDEDWPERIVPFIQNALDVFYNSWKGDQSRVTRVVGVQVGWYDVSERIVTHMRKGSFDLVSPTSYFGFDEEAIQALEEAGSRADIALVEQLALDSIESMGAEIQNIANLCNSLGVEMAYYEGGQHLTPDPFGSEQEYGFVLVDIQHDPCMYDIYRKWLAELEKIKVNANGNTTLCVIFSLSSSDSERYGSFGLLTDMSQEIDLDTVPKYRAVMDYMEK